MVLAMRLQAAPAGYTRVKYDMECEKTDRDASWHLALKIIEQWYVYSQQRSPIRNDRRVRELKKKNVGINLYKII